MQPIIILSLGLLNVGLSVINHHVKNYKASSFSAFAAGFCIAEALALAVFQH